MTQRLGLLASSTALLLGVITNPAFAKDPFRTSNPKPIGDRTEAAFKAIFEKGDYSPKTLELLDQAAAKEGGEPLVYALKATLAFMQRDGGTFTTNATMTRETAEKLATSDPLRGNLYIAVGNFLEAASTINTQGMVRGMPTALGKVQDAFKKLDEAEKVSPNDPELNLVKGAMDLMLAVNVSLPLSNPDQAIERLEQKAGPRYIADRSLAWGYRDLKKLDKAVASVDRALATTPDNPEVKYLKGQILYKQGKFPESIKFFEDALKKEGQLPTGLVNQIKRELRLANQRAQAGKTP
ncbi:Sll0314/Alr1548 family TPR repeat-containing protein [Alkalinema pantanalense CENA528]|uniref:Sll0314/Alr1548 family TPR repeat-containing protein n=1 Tax=Alkalinema pantanalense TaxID=1620705 RepID=UPI003D6F765D